MKIVSTLFILFTFSLSVFSQNNDILGDWYGKAEVNGTNLRITFHISEENDSLKATMDSPDQNAYGIPTDQVVFEEGFITIAVNSISLVYEGKLVEEEKIEGRIKQMGVINVATDLTKTPIEAEKITRPQTPKPPFNYKMEEVTFLNNNGGHQLAGTLTIPNEGTGKFPVVVLISGSGPQDRDESLANHKPFWVLADYLTSNGIAVLRYDDRGTAQSEGDFSAANSFDFADDVHAAIDYLKNRSEIDVNNIGLIGHSEGGMIAPIVASKDKSVAFIVLMAGLGTTGREVIETQSVLIARAQGIPQAFIDQTGYEMGVVMDAVEKYNDAERSEKDITTFIEKQLSALPPEQIEAMGGNEARIKLTLDRYNSNWMRTFIRFDPKPYLSKVKCPVLAINGKLDLQVEFKANLEGIEKSLKSGGNEDYSIVAIDDLNHLFQTATKGTPDEYPKIEETIAPKALKIMGDWIKQQTK